MKDGANLTLVILMAYHVLLASLLLLDFVLLLVALFTGAWWLFYSGCLATAGLVGWRWYQLRKLHKQL